MAHINRPRPMSTASAALACLWLLAGCSTVDNLTGRMAGIVQPYRVEIVQGNFVSREQVAALQPGMSRLQVREILGTPLLTSVFHANRWDYVFSLKRQGSDLQQRRLSVFFKEDALERFEGDEMPTEAEFVASLDGSRKAASKPRRLEATPEELARAAPAKPAGAAPASPPAAAVPAPSASPPPAAYPPLEPGAR